MFFAKRLYKSMKVNTSSIKYGDCFFFFFIQSAVDYFDVMYKLDLDYLGAFHTRSN